MTTAKAEINTKVALRKGGKPYSRDLMAPPGVEASSEQDCRPVPDYCGDPKEWGQLMYELLRGGWHMHFGKYAGGVACQITDGDTVTQTLRPEIGMAVCDLYLDVDGGKANPATSPDRKITGVDWGLLRGFSANTSTKDDLSGDGAEKTFRNEYLGIPWEAQVPDRERYLRSLAEEYHQRCDKYDRKVCTGPIENGSIRPASSEEMSKSWENARAVRAALWEKVKPLRFTWSEWLTVISKVGQIYRYKEPEQKGEGD